MVGDSGSNEDVEGSLEREVYEFSERLRLFGQVVCMKREEGVCRLGGDIKAVSVVKGC